MPETKFIQQSKKPKADWTRELFFHYQSTYETTPPQAIEVLFWTNLNTNKGFRLNHKGFEILKNLNYKFYEHNITNINSATMVQMDKQMNMPWFWNTKNKLYTMDNEFSIMCELTGGDLLQTLKNIG